MEQERKRDDLLQKVEAVRGSAARFYTVDLHVHSPCSGDWDNSGSEDEPRNPNLDRLPCGADIPDACVAEYCKAITGSGRELIAITDHNRSAFGEAAAGSDEPGLCVLPGIELSVAFSDAPLIRDLRVHVLAVFPEGTHRDAIARVLPSGTPPEDTREPRTPLTYRSVDELVDSVHEEGGLVIAAHIESTHGLRGVYKNTAELLLEPLSGSPEAQEVLKTLGEQVKDELVKFDAVQVKPTMDSIHYTSPEGNLRVPLIVASDCHEAKALSENQPDKYSFIKMAEPSFHALQEALKFPDLRVRFTTCLPTARPPRLLGLRIVGHKATENTFFDDTVLGFSDNLTCLIGPRGSGKSAMIDGLRYLMGYNRSLDQIQKVASQVVDRQKHTLEKSRIEALYQTADDQVYKLIATYDPQEEYATEVYDLQGNRLNIDDVEACGEFPLNLFGWSELELLAESPNTQRELLDRFITDVLALKAEKEDILLRLDENRQACLVQAEKMDPYFTQPERDFRRLNEYKAQYEELNTEDIEGVFAKFDAIKAKRTVLTTMESVLQDRLEEDDIAPALELAKHLEDETLKEWAEAFSARLKPDALDDWMRETSRQHESKVKTVLELVRSEDETLARQEDAAQKEIQSVIGEDKVITGDLRTRAKSRFEKVAANYAKYKEYEDTLTSLLNDRDKLLDELEDCDKRIFATRNKETRSIGARVSLVEDGDYQINLVLKQQADRSVFLTGLVDGGLVFSGHWKAGKHCEIISENLTPPDLARVILHGNVDALDGLSVHVDGVDYSINRKQTERLVADNTPFTEVEGLDTFRADIGKLDRILSVQQIPIDDDFFITLGGKPIQHCSPGQRCSAMLPVVALTSQAPLVIDQPEDNLDNRLVSRALFKILARLKETRQLILATHNPNILVSGDAEQVMLLDAEGQVEKHGCIDSSPIIDSVISLMEGGAEAFNRRRTKYEPFL